MDDKEKVIKGLESLRNICNAKSDMAIGKGKVAWAGYANTADDALALLKAQEPRVMTLEEVNNLPYGHVLIETDKNEPIRWLDALLFCKNINFSFDFITLEGRARLLGVEYNREWRCWTSWPTDEQRKAVKWDD